MVKDLKMGKLPWDYPGPKSPYKEQGGESVRVRGDVMTEAVVRKKDQRMRY